MSTSGNLLRTGSATLHQSHQCPTKSSVHQALPRRKRRGRRILPRGVALAAPGAHLAAASRVASSSPQEVRVKNLALRKRRGVEGPAKSKAKVLKPRLSQNGNREIDRRQPPPRRTGEGVCKGPSRSPSPSTHKSTRTQPASPPNNCATKQTCLVHTIFWLGRLVALG